MDLLWTKVWPKSLEALWSILPAAQSCEAAQPLTFCIFFLLTTWQQRSRDERRQVQRKQKKRKKKHFVIAVLHQTSPPWTGHLLKSMQCLQTSMKLVKQPKMLLSCLSADEGSKVRMLTHKKNKKESRFLMAGSSGIFTVLVWKVPCWMCCLITNSKPSLMVLGAGGR